VIPLSTDALELLAVTRSPSTDTGNEGPIELFANNTGLMSKTNNDRTSPNLIRMHAEPEATLRCTNAATDACRQGADRVHAAAHLHSVLTCPLLLRWDIAPDFNAMIVFAEHRYYGESLPFGAASLTNANYVHLSAEQALADYALFLTSLKSNMSIPDASVISFGGSYGGMLTAWFRKKYPHIVAGAIAGSAPIFFFDTLATDFDVGTYSRICSNDFKNVSQNCFDQIAAS
jgi:hypothetical protein